MPDLLAGKLKMDRDLFLKSVEKLAAQGVAQIDLGGLVRRSGSPETTASWQSGYAEQIAFRRAQIDRMIQFAETQQCRMTALIRHFGDTADGHRPCGLCDFCSPNSATAQTFAQPTPQEEHALRAILRALDANPKATGRLFTDAAVTHDRRHFDALLDGLARAGLITLSSETWTNPAGDLIAFKKAALTHEARTLGSSEPLGVMLRPASSAPAKLKSRKRAAASSRPAKMPVAKPAAEKAPSVSPDTPSLYARQRAPTPDPTAALDPAQQQLDRRLRAWRQAESEKIGLPQFFVLGSSTLRSIVLTRPSSLTQLRGIAGMGPEKTDRFGASILEICNS
jgi:ATP-dependent DNA helicase RecQ